jgi:SOS-response transcriptional repressor LexA
MTTPALTPRQTEVMAYLRAFHADEDRLPSSREIQAHFGFASQTGAVGHLRALAKHGLIEHRERNSRGWWRFARAARLDTMTVNKWSTITLPINTK